MEQENHSQDSSDDEFYMDKFGGELEFANTLTSQPLTPIYIRNWNDQRITFHAKNYSETVGWLLKQYQASFNVPKQKPYPYFYDRNVGDFVDECQKLQKYEKHIQAGDIIFDIICYQEPPLFLKPKKECFSPSKKTRRSVEIQIDQKMTKTLNLFRQSTIEELYEKVRELVQGDIVLVYRGIQLSDQDVWTLEQKGIQEGAIIYMAKKVQGSIDIKIRGKNNQIYDLHDIPTTLTIACLKEMIEQRTQIKSQQQKLVFAGKVLAKDKSICDYSIQKQSIIQLIQTYSKQLSINYIKQKKIIEITLEKLPAPTVSQLMLRISEKTGIPPQQQILVYSNTQLNPEHNFSEYNNFRDKNYQINLVTKAEFQGLQSIQKVLTTINIKSSGCEDIKFSYIQNYNKTVKQVIQSFVPNPRSSYCLLYGEGVIEPHFQLRKIESLIQYETPQISCYLLKAYDKNLFMNLMNYQYTIPPLQELNIAEKYSSRIKDKIENTAKATKQSLNLVNQVTDIIQFCLPLAIYTSPFYRELNKRLRDLYKVYDSNFFNSNHHKVCSKIVNSLNCIRNHIGEVHRGIKNEKFSYRINQVITWNSFTSTTQIKDKAIKIFANDEGTLFHIKSLTGKDISNYSIYPNQKEVLFLPYTYFIVDQIQQNKGVDEVWLSEIPSPITFKKNIIAWVDDKPKNNIKLMHQILQQNKNQTEILQLTSTKMAQSWFEQFSWFLNYKNIQFKVISDMVREEYGEDNYYAGIDLLQNIFNKYGYTAPILIYCGNIQNAKKNIKDRKIRQDRIYSVENKVSAVKQYCKFK